MRRNYSLRTTPAKRPFAGKCSTAAKNTVGWEIKRPSCIAILYANS